MKIIIIGAGIIGFTIADRLAKEGHDVVIIEKNEKCARVVRESLDVKLVKGSGSSPRILIEAGIEKADMIVAVTDSDEVNMIACLIAGSQSSVPKKVARIRNPDYLDYTRIFEESYLGLDLNINPQKMAAERILKIIMVPGSIDVIDFYGGRIKLVGTRLSGDSTAAGKRLSELKELHPDHKVILVAIYREGETIVPQGSTVLKVDDLVFAVSLSDETSNLLKILGRSDKSGNRIIIVGGGNVGYHLAKNLEESNYRVKVFETDEKRCSFLTENLSKTLVICGDGTDEDLLAEENISDTDTFVSVTNNEEANILTSIMSKRLGVSRCISLVDKTEYLSILPKIGIDTAVSPRLSSVSAILQFIRRGNVLSVTTLMEERMEALETIAMETSDIVGKPLREIHFPKEVIVGSVIKGDDIIIPDGKTVISPGDKVIFFTPSRLAPRIEKFLMVKPDFF